MAYMRSTLAFILFWINLIILAITLYIAITENIKNEKKRYYPDYLRTTMEKLQNIYPYYFLDEEFILSNHLRNLLFYPKPIMSALLSIVPLIALFTLMLSFCLFVSQKMNVVQIMQKLMRISLWEIALEHLNVIVIAHIVKEERIATVVRMVVVVY